MNIFLIFVGGGLGAVCRFTLTRGIDQLTLLRGFPLGVLATNLVGCFLIGLAFGHFVQRPNEQATALLVTGFLGGFTTFSTFGKDTFLLLQDGLTLQALMNVALSVTLGVIAVGLGFRVTNT